MKDLLKYSYMAVLEYWFLLLIWLMGCNTEEGKLDQECKFGVPSSWVLLDNIIWYFGPGHEDHLGILQPGKSDSVFFKY